MKGKKYKLVSKKIEQTRSFFKLARKPKYIPQDLKEFIA